MNQTMTVREQVSALADGHLQGEAFAQAIEAVCADRRGARGLAGLPPGGRRAALGLACAVQRHLGIPRALPAAAGAEPVVTAPAKPVPVAAPVALPVQRSAEAANEPVFRWKLVAGAASLMAVAAISWTLVGNGAAVPQSGRSCPGGRSTAAAQQVQPAVNSVLAAVP
jgi:sigma-E factor negative regulatory protein RseA